jgi:CRP/FNR family transcriptional regulator, cyclic AMP receptor protein
MTTGLTRVIDVQPVSLVLGDRRRITLRRADDHDCAAIVELYENLSTQSRYQRFFHPTPRLNRQLRDFLIDLARAEVWLAFDGDTCVGESRISPYPDRDRADLAVTVADAYQNKGLGRHLARMAINGRNRGHKQIMVTIQPANTAAIRLARAVDVTLRLDGGVLEGAIRLPLVAVPDPHPQEVPAVSKHDSKIDHLATIPPFRRCTRRQLLRLAQLTTELDAARGAVLCREGDVGRECFIVRDGEATVTIDGEQIATIGPGGVVGELALLDGEPRVATVTAATDMRLLVLSRPEFNQVLAEIPTVSRGILESVGARLRAADARLSASAA